MVNIIVYNQFSKKMFNEISVNFTNYFYLNGLDLIIIKKEFIFINFSMIISNINDSLLSLYYIDIFLRFYS